MNRNDYLPQGLEPGLFMYKYKVEDAEAHWFHAHRGIEMLYIYSGHGEIMAENQTYAIRDHTLVWFQPYQLHRVLVPAAEGHSYIRTNLTFDPGFLERYLAAFPLLEKFFRSLWRGSLQRPVVYDMHNTPVAAVLEELHYADNSPAADREENMGLLMLQLIRLLQKTCPACCPRIPITSHAEVRMLNGLPAGWMNTIKSLLAWRRWPPRCTCHRTIFHICLRIMPGSPCLNM